MKKKLLIIGSNGYIGSKLSTDLSKKYIVFKSHVENIRKLDIRDLKHLEIFVKKKKIDFILNLTGQSNEKNLLQNSVKGNNNLILLSKKFTNLKIFFFSSALVYGNNKKMVAENDNTNPLSKYSKIKKKIEQLYLKSGKEFKILRIASIYDSEIKKKKGLLCNIKKMLKTNKPLIIPNLKVKRNYLLLDDFCQIVSTLIKNYDSVGYKIINIGNENLSIENIIKIFEKKYNKKIIFKIKPNKFDPSISLNINKMKSLINFKRLKKLKDII